MQRFHVQQYKSQNLKFFSISFFVNAFWSTIALIAFNIQVVRGAMVGQFMEIDMN